jgi:hypothetical protein
VWDRGKKSSGYGHKQPGWDVTANGDVQQLANGEISQINGNEITRTRHANLKIFELALFGKFQ